MREVKSQHAKSDTNNVWPVQAFQLLNYSKVIPIQIYRKHVKEFVKIIITTEWNPG